MSRLAERLVRLAAFPGASAVPAAWPADRALLGWLRRLTTEQLYTWQFEETMARRWWAGDPFGRRVVAPPPLFLAAVDQRGLPARQVAPLLRRLSLTRRAPCAAELTPAALDASAGPVACSARSAEPLGWARPEWSEAPRLPPTVRIPHLLHSIWLGSRPPTGRILANLGAAAVRYRGRVDVVLWTDLTRETADRVRAGGADGSEPDAAAAALLSWAAEHGVHVLDVREVFHAGAPMTLHAAFETELTKRLPRGCAAASDHLRVDLIHRFGGAYADGDHSFEPGSGPGPADLPELLAAVARSPLGLTLNLIGEGQPHPDVVVAPAGHPAVALWRECARLSYFASQPGLFGGIDTMALPYAGRPWQEHRYVVTQRSGRVHLLMLQRLGLGAGSLTPVRPALRPGREHSWLPAAGPEPAVLDRRPDMLPALADCLTFLRWQLIAREGNLYLTAVDPVIRGLPDPAAAWTALLSALPDVIGDVPPVTSVTDLRRNDDGSFTSIGLPPAAAALLDRDARPPAWLGSGVAAGGTAWLFDERVTPVALRPGRAA